MVPRFLVGFSTIYGVDGVLFHHAAVLRWLAWRVIVADYTRKTKLYILRKGFCQLEIFVVSETIYLCCRNEKVIYRKRSFGPFFSYILI